MLHPAHSPSLAGKAVLVQAPRRPLWGPLPLVTALCFTPGACYVWSVRNGPTDGQQVEASSSLSVSRLDARGAGVPAFGTVALAVLALRRPRPAERVGRLTPAVC